MKYFLFLTHPKGKEIYEMSKESEEKLRKYFNSKDILKMKIILNNKEYLAHIDYEIFKKEVNFDCFNCNNDCCADSPSILTKKTRKFILKNLEEFNKITKNIDIVQELGYEIREFYDELNSEKKRTIIQEIEEETGMCFYGYKREDRATLCGIHSLCIKKNMEYKKISEYKPLVCILWPLEIFIENDNKDIYITLPDDFTNSFTIENYYTIPCINKELSSTNIFRKQNPKGFEKEKYIPFIEAYKETLMNIFGEKIYNKIKDKIKNTEK